MEIFASIHMGKTAGTSFAHLLINSASYRFPVLLYYGTGHPFTGIWSGGSQLHFSGQESKEQLTEMFVEHAAENGAGLVQAHWLVPEFLDVFGDSVKFITWLRDPVQRICSWYFFWKDSDSEPMRLDRRDLFWAVKSGRCSLLDFGTHPRVCDFYRKTLAPLDPEDMTFVGVLERQQASLRLLSQVFGMPLPDQLEAKNVTKQKQGATYRIPNSVEEAILAHNKADVTIYAAAVARLEPLDPELCLYPVV